jgi:lactaldehyde dehydrogenase/glycolaldehyde dehydrogenase
MSDTAQPRGAYIGGQWRAASGPAHEVFDPATGEVTATVAGAAAGEVDEALQTATDAQPGWARTTAAERGRRVRAIGDLLAAHRDAFARLIVGEVGKPRGQAYDEVDFAIEFIRFGSEWDRRLEGEILPGDSPDEVVHLLREPVGVVAAICPWNFPLAVLCRKLGPALVTGNAVVVKPSEVTPLGALELARLIDEAGLLAPGVLNVVPGARETGEALVASPLTSLVSFTGHRDTGKAVMATASRHLTRVALELGGKAPVIVDARADLDVAVPAIVKARHLNAGQVCTAAERVLVHRSRLEEFTERYVDGVRRLVVGDPAGEVDMGPLVSAAQLEKTRRMVEVSRREGAEVLLGGDRPDDLADSGGYWYAPTVLAGIEPTMHVMVEETFGPVTPIFGVDSLDEALAIANDSRYGLSAYVFSDDYRAVMRATQDLSFGEIYVNRTLGESVHAHHAGYRESGIGGEDGKWGMLRYTQIKTAYHQYG